MNRKGDKSLIVGLDCDLGNPALISRGIVGG